jgi:hypothetical protein
VPQSVASLLFDHEYFQKMADQGKKHLASKDMDPLDHFFANSFLQCFKSDSDTYTHVFEAPALRRARLPSVRSAAQLEDYLNNPMLTAAPDSTGFALASEAWGVIGKNFYFTEVDKYRLVGHIASLQNKLTKQHAEAAEMMANGHKFDLLQQPGFRKGREYWEEEKRLAILAGHKPVDDLQYVQGATDWEVDAVEDEDDL